jgi:hypothetical protein
LDTIFCAMTRTSPRRNDSPELRAVHDQVGDIVARLHQGIPESADTRTSAAGLALNLFPRG